VSEARLTHVEAKLVVLKAPVTGTYFLWKASAGANLLAPFWRTAEVKT
jgi:hypothetical protein